jgi:hypothetical protein
MPASHTNTIDLILQDCQCVDDCRVVRRLAPEDIVAGMYIVEMFQELEVPPCEKLFSDLHATVEPVRITIKPWHGMEPTRVVAVCLPSVLVKTARGDRYCMDVRHFAIGRVSDAYGKAVFKALDPKRAARRTRQHDAARERKK